MKRCLSAIIAEVESADGETEGVIVTEGGMTRDFALLVQSGKPTFIYNWLALERYTVARLHGHRPVAILTGDPLHNDPYVNRGRTKAKISPSAKVTSAMP